MGTIPYYIEDCRGIHTRWRTVEVFIPDESAEVLTPGGGMEVFTPAGKSIGVFMVGRKNMEVLTPN